MAERIKLDEPTKKELECQMLNFIHRKVAVDYIPTGSTLLNLAASQNIHGGHARGRIVNPVGDGSAGKTLLALEAAANFIKFVPSIKSHCYQTPKLKDIIIKYNNRETVMDFPIEKMYGQKFMDIVEFYYTESVEAFGADFFKICRDYKTGQSVLYVIDSWDSLDSEEDMKSFDAELDKRIKNPDWRPGKDDAGSYNLGKQKYGTQRFFKKCCSEMEGKDITLMIISQTRQKIGVTFGDKKYRSGGDALNFFTHQVPWLREVRKLHKTVFGEKKDYGIEAHAKFKRNKASLPFREAKFCILFDYGIDDIMSNLNYLFGPEAKVWDIGDEKFTDIKAAILYIEEMELEEPIQKLAADKWYKAEQALIDRTPIGGRKPRF